MRYNIGSNGDGGGFVITTEYIVGAAGNHSAAHNPHISIAIVDPACEKIGRHTAYHQKDLQTASAANKERLMKSIERDRKRTEDKIDELEKRKLLGVSTAFQSVLILEVV